MKQRNLTSKHNDHRDTYFADRKNDYKRDKNLDVYLEELELVIYQQQVVAQFNDGKISIAEMTLLLGGEYMHQALI